LCTYNFKTDNIKINFNLDTSIHRFTVNKNETIYEIIYIKNKDWKN